MLYNVLICQDLARGYQRKNISPRCILKIDLQKAFDSIHWDFLKEFLLALKFPMTFIKWILACVTSVTFLITLNGQDSERFKGGRTKIRGPFIPLALCHFNAVLVQTTEGCKHTEGIQIPPTLQ